MTAEDRARELVRRDFYHAPSRPVLAEWIAAAIREAVEAERAEALRVLAVLSETFDENDSPADVLDRARRLIAARP
jgi:hypothetical protein